jgi:hypothetical protein
VYRPEVCPENPKLRAFTAWWKVNGPFPIKYLRGDTTDAEQRKLYAQGRTTPGKVVTNAPTAAKSAHGHSGALDAAPVRELFPNGAVKLIYLGDETDPAVRTEAQRRYEIMADIAETLFGLESGRHFPGLPDRPHLQDPEWVSRPLNEGVAP